MNTITSALTALFDRIPRRHTTDNVKEINSILTDYEDVLIEIEGVNEFYEKHIGKYFDEADAIKVLIKKSNDNKASKKVKDEFFDEASGNLKDSIEGVIELYGDGSRKN